MAPFKIKCQVGLHCLGSLTLTSSVSVQQDFQSKDLPNTRIQPNRGWFQNSRVTDQKALEKFREEMSTKVALRVPYEHWEIQRC